MLEIVYVEHVVTDASDRERCDMVLHMYFDVISSHPCMFVQFLKPTLYSIHI